MRASLQFDIAVLAFEAMLRLFRPSHIVLTFGSRLTSGSRPIILVHVIARARTEYWRGWCDDLEFGTVAQVGRVSINI